MTLFNVIHEKLVACNEGRINLTDFYEWVVKTTWELPYGQDVRAEALLGRIELYFAEYDRGHRGFLELRTLLKEISATDK